MTRIEWLEARQKTIGSSDAANLIGIGFRDALAVYQSKTEPVNPTLPSDGYLRRGIEVEPLVAVRYCEVMGCDLTPDQENVLVYSNERPWQSATPDRRRSDDGRPVEIKTVAGWHDDWGDSGSSDIPSGYFAQATHQLGVIGERILDLAALNVIDWTLRVYRIDFDPDFFAWLTDVERQFYEEYLVPKVAPPLGWEQRWRPRAPLPAIEKGTRLDLGAGVAAKLDRRKVLMTLRDEADEAVKRITAEVESAMGESEQAVAGFWKVKRTLVKGGTVSYERKDYVRTTISGG